MKRTAPPPRRQRAALAIGVQGARGEAFVDQNEAVSNANDVTGKRRHPLIEFVMITGYASFESAVEALSLGAYDYLVKPFIDIKEVAAKLHRAAEKATLARRSEALARDLKAKNAELEVAIVLTAISTVLGLIPIAPTVFRGPMAFAIMGGLLVATLLMLVFLPALYVTVFGGKPAAAAEQGAA